jgi:hypothetical protein
MNHIIHQITLNLINKFNNQRIVNQLIVMKIKRNKKKTFSYKMNKTLNK